MLAQSPDHHDGRLLLAHALVAADQATAGLQTAAAGCATYPNSEQMHLIRAFALDAGDRACEAIVAAEVATRINPNSVAAWVDHARYLVSYAAEMGGTSPAQAEFLETAGRTAERAQALNPAFVTAGRTDPSSAQSAELLGWARFSDWQWDVVAVMLVIPTLSFLDGSYAGWMGVPGVLGLAGAAWLTWGKSNRLSDEAETIQKRHRRLR